MNNWGNWPDELHIEYEQVQRIESAKEKKITKGILKLNKEVPYIVIQGSGSEPYTATLRECNCFDFSSRQRPCKHIYRLAMELELLELPEKTQYIDRQAEADRYKQLYTEGKIPGSLYVALCKALK